MTVRDLNVFLAAHPNMKMHWMLPDKSFVPAQYPIGGMAVTPSGLLFYLGTKHTACLAPEKCKVGDAGCC